jgi:oligoendopeptidase F
MSAADVSAVDDVTWDLETLLPEAGPAGVDQLLDQAAALADQIETYRDKISGLDNAQIAALLRLQGELGDLMSRAGSYAGLRFSVATDDPEVGALMARTEERSTAISSRLIFVELELAALDDARELATSEELAFARHHLNGLRRYRPHLLNEDQEVIMAEKSVTGANAWGRLYDEQTSAIQVEREEGNVPLDVALSEMQAPTAESRRDAAEAITASLESGLRTRAFIFNTLLADKTTDDRLRSYPTWLSSRNLSNEASDASVDALISAVVGRYDIPQRWYALKARLMGVDKISVWDRYAPLGSDTVSYSWEDATSLVVDSYQSFSPAMADVVREFLSEPWIDAPIRPSKRGGAFCAYTVPSHHPYLLLNWTDRRRDVLTLAHELGHGIHAYLARPQGIFHQSTPLTLAETASVFGETVTFGKLLEDAKDPTDRLPLLAEHLEDQIATVFRQIAMNRFEDGVHTHRREVGELSIDRFGELWLETQTDMLGESVEIDPAYATWWSYIPHFIHTPGYVYAYAYGQLLALSVYAQYEQRGAEFVPSYLEMLSAGGSMPPEELGRIVGVDLGDPAFWDGGLDIIDGVLREAEQTAVAAGRL